MKLISWNVRGLNGSHKKEIIRNLIRDQRWDFLLVQETKMKKEVVSKLSFNSNMFGEASDLKGATGGVLPLYKNKAY